MDVDGDRNRARSALSESKNISLERTGDGNLVVRIASEWRLRHGMPSADQVKQELVREPQVRRVVYDARQLREWDSSLASFVTGVDEICRALGIDADRTGLPQGLQRLVRLAETVPEKRGVQDNAPPPMALERIGANAIRLGE